MEMGRGYCPRTYDENYKYHQSIDTLRLQMRKMNSSSKSLIPFPAWTSNSQATGYFVTAAGGERGRRELARQAGKGG